MTTQPTLVYELHFQAVNWGTVNTCNVSQLNKVCITVNGTTHWKQTTIWMLSKVSVMQSCC